ncbi:sodium/calcium exchanger 1-like isoform X2 [Mobula hypostoma]
MKRRRGEPRMAAAASLGLGLLLLAGVSAGSAPTEPTDSNDTCRGLYNCQPGILLPPWRPLDPSPGDKAARAAVYFAAMAYLFLGMSIAADRFMASIEVITSQEREVRVRRADGEVFTTRVRVWNETVSNLTLMALGSSAPEILLSVIEVCGHGFEAGELGPATIVGSAAFNMLVIVAICVSAVPAGQHRRIRHLPVFFTTAFWSVFAYVWLYLMLAVLSPGVVEVWEALLTFAFFPACVLLAWAADRRLLLRRFARKRYRADKAGGAVIVEGTGGPEPEPEAAAAKRTMARLLRELKQRHPNTGSPRLMEMASYQALLRQSKSRAFYRVHATRRLTGEGDVLKQHAAERTRRLLSLPAGVPGPGPGPERPRQPGVLVYFDPAEYRCSEDCGWLQLTVVVEAEGGGGAGYPVAVDYRTEEGTATAGSDYEHAEGTLRFGPGEARGLLPVRIVDDDVYEPDEFFQVRLSNPRAEGVGCGGAGAGRVALGPQSLATVTILDDDHAGMFAFERGHGRVSESVGAVSVRVLRTSGSRGAVLLPYRTAEGTAKAGEDFVGLSGQLLFQNDETVKTIEVQIINDEEYEKNKNFFIELGQPKLVGSKIQTDYSSAVGKQEELAQQGCPCLGEHLKMEIVIEESYEFKSTVDKLIKKTSLALAVSSSSWKEQFVNAVTVSAGEDNDDGGSSEKQLPSYFDYIMHFLTVFWKVLFAFVPPTEYLNGWACFVVSIMLIGVLTTITGDLAKHFGCTIGLKNSVTAIVFVALGTSIPDTFASKVAAVQDQFADASISNVTGSNAVNVFLGIGVAWTMSAIYWASKGQPFRVDPGNLAFSVTIFTIFAFVAITTLLCRRRRDIGGELGGPWLPKLCTSAFFILLWLAYIVLSSLEAYCYITGF